MTDFSSPHFLTAHIQKTLDFYAPNAFDASGGFFHHFRDDGSVYEHRSRHLVSSTRFVFNYAMAAMHFQNPSYMDWAEHGLRYVLEQHLQSNGGFAWLLEQNSSGQTQVTDGSNHAYGLAFVIVAGATAVRAGVAADNKPIITAGKKAISIAWNTLERYFWDGQQGLYRDEASPDFSHIAPYRGQNANMHACEAMLWAFEATQEQRYLERAFILAHNTTQRLAQQSQGVCQNLVWEHYREAEKGAWVLDLQYNLDNPKHLFRPWGYQPGHQTEWAKLLLILARHCSAPWLLASAKHLFDRALTLAWDEKYGGIVYGFDLEGKVCDDDKYFWVQAESFAAAKLLFAATQDPQYQQWYERIWQYSWQHMVDHRYGAWFRILRRNNTAYDDLKSPAGKTDYHTMGACYEVLRSSLNQDQAPSIDKK